MKYCSLGDGCMMSVTLKSLGLKTESYPFDWINSNTDIVIDCISDDFNKFLDKSFYSAVENPWDKERLCQHDYYKPLLLNSWHPSREVLFRHRDLIQVESDYDYYVRCVDRFRNMLASEDDKVFLKTYINATQSCLDDALLLTQCIEEHTTNFKLIAVKHSITGEQSMNISYHGNLIYIEITSVRATDGGTFHDRLDQTFFNSLIENFAR